MDDKLLEQELRQFDFSRCHPVREQLLNRLLDRLLTKDEVRFMLSFKKKRVVKLTAADLAERNNISEEKAEEIEARLKR